LVSRLIGHLEEQYRSSIEIQSGGVKNAARSSMYKVSEASTASASFIPSNFSGSLGLQQKEQLRLQDLLLVDIGDRLDRVYNEARVIGDETKLQGRLLDDIEEDVESAASVLQVSVVRPTD
jgi:hypothetical protein